MKNRLPSSCIHKPIYALTKLAILTGSMAGFAQEVINLGPGTTTFFVTPEDFPNGATINVPNGVSIDELLILPAANPASLDNTPPFEINIDGVVGSSTLDTTNFDINSFVPVSAVNISNTGAVSNLGLNGGAVVNNNGSITMAPSDSAFSTAVLLTSPFNATSGSLSSYVINNNGSISVSGNNIAGGVFGNAVVAYGGDGTVPGAVSLELNNTGVISLGDNATGTVVRWREADDIVITNSGTFDVGFTPIAGGINFDPIVFVRDRSQTPGIEFDDNMTITNEASGQLIGARIFLGSPFDGSQSYNVTFTNAGNVLASGSDVASPVAPGGAAFEIGGLSEFTNSGTIRIDGSLLDGGNGSGEFLDQFVELGAVPEQSDFDAQRMTFLNTASGVIDATNEGIEFQSGIVTNDGTIIARGEENGYGVLAFVPSLVATTQDLWNDSVDVVNNGLIQAGFVGVSKQLGVVNMNLTNSGTIEIIQDTPFDPSAVTISEGTMSIVNEATGIIRGPTAISGTGDALSLVNNGLIEGDITFTGAANFQSSGSIIGDIDVGAGNDTVASSGNIDGSVFLGDGNDTFTAQGGLSVTGNVDGGNGFDILRFQNASLLQGANGVNATFSGFDQTNLGGNISLANGIGTTVSLPAPNLVFESDVVFIVDALEDGTGDLVTTTGTVALNGGVVQAQSNDGAWSVARDYTILQADAGLSGTFDSAISNQTYLDATLAYTANSVILSLERIDGLIQGDILETTNAQQLSVAARVIPEIIHTQVSNSILSLLGSSASGTSVAASPLGMSTGLSAGDETAAGAGATGSAWLNITPTRYDQRAILPGTTGLQKIDGETVNFLAGVDRLVGSRFVAGAFVGYEDSEVDYRAISGFQENKGYLLGAYGGVAFNDWLYSSVNLNWAQLDNDLEERAFGAEQAQRASYDSERLSLGLDLTAITRRGSMSYIARAAYNYSKESYDAYRTGRGEVVQLRDLSLGRFSLTGEVSYQGEMWNPYLSLGYEIDSKVSNTVADDNGFVVNAGLRASRGERLTFEAYIATVTSRSNENQELLGLNINYAF